MKNRAFVFILAALVSVCLTTCFNPIMEKWWDDGTSAYNWGKYTVQFDMAGGTYVDELPIHHREKPDTQVIEAGKAAMDPGLAEKGTQAFGGWYTEPSGGKRWHFGSGGDPVNRDMTLYAHWGAAGHLVEFKEITGDDIDSPQKPNGAIPPTPRAVYTPINEMIVHGELATEPLQFGAEGSSTDSFKGWYTWTKDIDDANNNGSIEKEELVNGWDFMRDTVTAPVTLYAKWDSASKYKIEWDVGTSPDDAPDPMFLTEGSNIPQPVAITNPGYAFAGWYTTGDFAYEWNFAEDTVGPTYAAGTTITLYAKWTTPGMSGTGTGTGKTFTLGGNGYPNTDGGVSVTIKRDFYIDQYEITNERYLTVMGNVPSRGQGSNMPLNRITWYDALEYCNKLSEREGLTPFYTLSFVVRGKDGAVSFIKSATVTVADWQATGYRLPTEAEWEYAARGGENVVGTPNETIYAGSDNPDEVAWHNKNSGFVPHPVGGKKPNAIGLYDMSGNLSEWCWDTYSSTIYEDYVGLAAIDPRNDDNSSKALPERVRRGGNFNMINVKVRSRDNNNTDPTFSWPPAPADDSLQRYMTIGFRVVRTIPAP